MRWFFPKTHTGSPMSSPRHVSSRGKNLSPRPMRIFDIGFAKRSMSNRPTCDFVNETSPTDNAKHRKLRCEPFAKLQMCAWIELVTVVVVMLKLFNQMPDAMGLSIHPFRDMCRRRMVMQDLQILQRDTNGLGNIWSGEFFDKDIKRPLAESRFMKLTKCDVAVRDHPLAFVKREPTWSLAE